MIGFLNDFIVIFMSSYSLIVQRIKHLYFYTVRICGRCICVFSDSKLNIFIIITHHGAYAWVKGNHIDHHVAVQCEKLGVESKLSKAGVTWQYLQFSVDDIKTLFFIFRAYKQTSLPKVKSVYTKLPHNR